MRGRTISLVVLALGLATACAFHAQQPPLTLSISATKQAYAPAEPVCLTVTLTNSSKGVITFEQPKLAHNLTISATSEDGIDSGIGEENSTYLTVYSELQNQQSDGSCSLLPGGKYQITLCGILRLLPAPCTWQLWAEYEGRGRFVTVRIEGQEPKKWNCEGCWKGSVTSNKVGIRFEIPIGADQAAFNSLVKPFITNFKGGDPEGWLRDTSLAKDYSDSVYATWARFAEVQSALHLYCGPFVNHSDGMKYLPLRRQQYSPTNRDELAKQEKSRAPYLIEQCRIILRNHPNLEPIASTTHVNLAALLYITGDTSGAKDQLDTIIKARPDSDEGRAAKQILDVISGEGPAPSASPK